MTVPASTPISSHLARAITAVAPRDTMPSFIIGSSQKSYKHQYSNIYFVRLRYIREHVEGQAHRRWKQLDGNPTLVPRVLEVTKSRLCYIIGTVYMDMPLKPNVMEDLARDHSIPPPPSPTKFYSPDDNVMLEDESGRIRLVGDCLKAARLVTGVIIGALGMETPNGDFEVVDICYAGLAPQHSTTLDMDKMNVCNGAPDPWIGVVSGLEIGSDASSDTLIQMLVEYLTGEGGSVDDQVTVAQISRLIIAGNSLAAVSATGRGDPVPYTDAKQSRRYGHDPNTFSPHPILGLSAHMLDLGRAIPLHLLPGEEDPSGTILPQQPLPRAMFGDASNFSTFSCETNPTYLRLSPTPDDSEEPSATNTPAYERTLLIHSGQPLNDIFKYLPNRHNSKLSILESTLKWRHMAPTAPDTLWCHPYFAEDPFMLTETPDIYIVGGQMKFGTKIVKEDVAEKGKQKARCRIVMVPNFARTGILVLINLRSLDVKCVNFAVEGMFGSGGGEELQQLQSTVVPTPTPIEQASSLPKSSKS